MVRGRILRACRSAPDGLATAGPPGMKPRRKSDDARTQGILQSRIRQGLSSSSATRDWDAVRFSVAKSSPDQIVLCFVCELDHAPIDHGKLTFDSDRRSLAAGRLDPRVLTAGQHVISRHIVRDNAAPRLSAS